MRSSLAISLIIAIFVSGCSGMPISQSILTAANWPFMINTKYFGYFWRGKV